MAKKIKSRLNITRREFIKTGAVAAAACSVPSLAFGSKFPSIVAKVTHPGLITGGAAVSQEVARLCVDKALLMLTQKNDIKDAWQNIFPNLHEEDTIGLKVNAINRKCPTHPQVAYAIAQSMIDTLGMDPNKIIIWDRTTSELKKSGYTINESGKGIRCIGTVEKFSIPRWLLNKKQDETDGIGYDKDNPIEAGQGKTSLLSNILTKMCTYLINVPVIKDHGKAGVTLSLKNHYGTVDNPRDLHDNDCNPFAAQINAAAQIKNKTKLIICDAAYGIYDGGPLGAPQWREKSILAATDPVALDYMGMQIINARRKENGFDPVTDKAAHIKAAQKIGLGNCDPKNINLIKAVLA